jgi:glucose-6-phosphate 1-epimerase
MIDIDELDEKFSIEGELGFAELENDLVFITVSNKYADADICLYGAQVTSFRPRNAMDVLWISPDSYYEVGKPIRGGIPVCFPWFGPHQSDPQKPQHGFARLKYWDVMETSEKPNGETMIRLQLCSSEETKTYWPHDFCAEITITVGLSLIVSLKVTNTSAEPFEYGCALHTYYYLSALENLYIEGLQGTSYYDQLTGDYGIQEEALLLIHEPLTRHYLNTETQVLIGDSIFHRRIRAEKRGSKITTVWNPGTEVCSKIDDIPDEAFENFVCVEATNAFDFQILLAAGESYETIAIVGLEE